MLDDECGAADPQTSGGTVDALQHLRGEAYRGEDLLVAGELRDAGDGGFGLLIFGMLLRSLCDSHS